MLSAGVECDLGDLRQELDHINGLLEEEELKTEAVKKEYEEAKASFNECKVRPPRERSSARRTPLRPARPHVARPHVARPHVARPHLRSAARCSTAPALGRRLGWSAAHQRPTPQLRERSGREERAAPTSSFSRDRDIMGGVFVLASLAP
jgi:hypothetical protein